MPGAGTTQVDRLTVELPGTSTEEGRHLALAIAAEMARAGGMPAAGDVPTLRVVVPGRRDATMKDTAQRVVAAIVRELRRSP